MCRASTWTAPASASASAVAGHFVATKRKFVYFVKSATGVFPSRSRSWSCNWSRSRSPPEPGRRLLLTFASQNHRRDMFLPPPCPVSVCPCLAFCVRGWQKLQPKTNHTLLLRANCQCADKKLCTKRHKLCCSIFFRLSCFALHCLFSFASPPSPTLRLSHVQHLHSLLSHSLLDNSNGSTGHAHARARKVIAQGQLGLL